MTFTLPEELAAQFVQKVPARERSKYVAVALTERLSERDRKLVRACQAANNNPEVQAIEKEFDAIAEEAAAPWGDTAARRRVVGAARSRARRRD